MARVTSGGRGSSSGGVPEWRPLPEGLSAEMAHFAEELRRLHAGTGLTRAAAARRAAVGRSSLERYLNGRALPPRTVVEALCRAADADPRRMLALWELADLAWSRRGATSRERPADPVPGGAGDAEPGPGGRRRRSARLRIAAAAGAVALLGAGAALLLPHAPQRDAGAGRPRAAGGLSPSPAPASCRGASCEGKYAAPMACNDVRTLGSPTHPDPGRPRTRVELRYSPACGTAWLRVTMPRLGAAFAVSDAGARPQRVVVAERSQTSAYAVTPMVAVPGPGRARACYAPDGGCRVSSRVRRP